MVEGAGALIGGPMSVTNLERGFQDRIERLERRCRRFTWLLGTLASVFAFILLAQLSESARASQATSAAPSSPDDVLLLRELVIVDANGTPRVRIAAPLPDPIMLGKRFKRGDPVSGILIYDAEGNERGGYVTGDGSRGAALTLDEINRAAIHIGVGERGDSHVMLSNGRGGFAAMGMLPDGGFLRLEHDGQPPVVLPAALAGAGK